MTRRKDVEGFWDQARASADEDQQTGYLGDEWPQALSKNRFAGEWAQVSRWMDELGVGKGAVLDVGCGIGLWLEHFATRFERAHGVDLSSEMVASARRRLAKLPNVTVEHKGVEELAMDGQLDLIFVGGVLMYVEDPDLDGVVANLGRLLAPGGVAIFRESTRRGSTWNRETPLQPGLFADRSAPRAPYHAIYRPRARYREVFARNGLEVVRSEPNRPYKLADLTETVLRAGNRVAGGALAKDRARAERWAASIHRHRWFWLLPPYYAVRALAPWVWKIHNTWFVVRRARQLGA